MQQVSTLLIVCKQALGVTFIILDEFASAREKCIQNHFWLGGVNQTWFERQTCICNLKLQWVCRYLEMKIQAIVHAFKRICLHCRRDFL